MPHSAATIWLRAARRRGFSRPLTWLIRETEKSAVVRMDFGICRLRRGEKHGVTWAQESLWVLLRGSARLKFAGQSVVVKRASVFAAGPYALSASPGTRVEIHALTSDVEWAVMRTANARLGTTRLYRPEDVALEHRGEGLAQGACQRLVRTVFDHAARPDSAFVLGEVVNLPGRWSSYPPHHHAQPEIYHYRFTAPAGYGHAEVGKNVYRVTTGDTTVIPGGQDHAQVSAPGYGMYYLWVVRHLPGRPYRGFKVTPAYRWLLDPAHQGWQPPAALFP